MCWIWIHLTLGYLVYSLITQCFEFWVVDVFHTWGMMQRINWMVNHCLVCSWVIATSIKGIVVYIHQQAEYASLDLWCLMSPPCHITIQLLFIKMIKLKEMLQHLWTGSNHHLFHLCPYQLIHYLPLVQADPNLPQQVVMRKYMRCLWILQQAIHLHS